MSTVSIKGSGNKYYNVDLLNVTCNCRDFQYRRCNFNIGDSRRLCKHLKEAMDFSNEVQNQPSTTSKRYSSNDMSNYIDSINNLLNTSNEVLSYMLCGGIRRGESTIDELIYVVYLFSIDRKPKLDNNTKILEYSDKSIKFEGYKGITVTMKFVDNCSYPFMTLYNTGPTEFIVKVKSTLKRKLKLGLNEYGFIREDGSIITNDLGTEEEIFEYLGFEYLNPHNR